MADALSLKFLPSSTEGNAILSPSGEYVGAYFTLIGGGNDADQNALGEKIADAVNAPSALSDAFAVVDGGNSITVHFSEIKAAKAFRDSFPLAKISSEFFAPAPETASGKAFTDLVNLVIAAREAFDCGFLPEEESRALDNALEPFASRVRYANEPDEENDASTATGSSPSSTDGGKNGG